MVPPLLGSDDDPAEHLRTQRPARLPHLERFERELPSHHYDIVRISGVVPNFGKVREMCRHVRLVSPHSAIVVGSHVAGIPGIETMIAADHIVHGEGIAWMRALLGEDPNAPIVHPEVLSGFGFRILGIGSSRYYPRHRRHHRPSVGCRWAATSAPERDDTHRNPGLASIDGRQCTESRRVPKEERPAA
jgi:hypothetical protein